jgi:2,3-bisphosphoglycerate-independent phosphoglycerate mutase
MSDFDLIRDLALEEKSKIVMLVMDGLGGLPLKPGGKTELESARKPNLDQLAREGICGQSVPIATGITPGSGPAHLALFGYDPIQYEIGRGVLEAVGIGFDLGPHDLAARGNFCTIDENGLITDRRAGRIQTDKSSKLCEELQKIRLPGVETFVRPVKEHRFVVVFRNKELTDGIADTDPQQVGLAPLPAVAERPEAQATADVINSWLKQAREILAGHHPANMVTLRGVAKTPALPQMGDVFKLKCGAIATYPMYRGVAKLVGMELLSTGDTIASEFETLQNHFSAFDFFYVHIKKTDSYGEDGNFDAKVHIIEEVDEFIPSLMALSPDVIAVTGDHSSPALLKSHSWHPVPTLIWSAHTRTDAATSFSELECTRGGLGHFHAKELMPLLMANALRLAKFGA